MLGVMAVLALPRSTPAQPAPDPVARAAAQAATGDTSAALALLDSVVTADFRNGRAWQLIGVLNWEQARSHRRAGYIKDRQTIRRLSRADTALRLAVQFTPDSARYHLSLARFNLQSGISTMRFAAEGEMRSAAAAAGRSGDASARAQALDELGMFAWRRFEAVANRAIATDDQRIQLESASNWKRNQAQDVLRSFVSKVEPPTGASDYGEAVARFREALAADSTNARVSRHLYMALAERRDWGGLLSLATVRGAQYPLDAQSRLARGLALHRLQRGIEATAAFDSALALLDEDERARFTRVTRILRPTADGAARAAGGDSASYSKLPEGQRRGLETMYWFLNDPLTLTAEHEYRLEFLARITHAEFRWTDEDQGLRGADTDRGDIYVRYGPPSFEMTVAGGTWRSGGVTLVWGYPDGLTFFFDLTPGFATSRLALNDRDYVEQLRRAAPVSWANLGATVRIDTMPVRVARFRGRGDSTDVVIAAAVPADSLVQGSPGADAALDLDLRVFDQFVRVQGVESTQERLSVGTAPAALDRSWRRRLGPGTNVLRVEALQPETRHAARAVVRLDAEPSTGFGMSDVLVGTRTEAAGAPAAPTSWRDVPLEPRAGPLSRDKAVALAWELYALPPRDGVVRYRVAISVARAERGGALGLAVRVVDGLGRAVGRGKEDRARDGRDRFTISFDRTAAPAERLVESLALDLRDVPPGRYDLTVEVTDGSSQRRAARTVVLRVR